MMVTGLIALPLLAALLSLLPRQHPLWAWMQALLLVALNLLTLTLWRQVGAQGDALIEVPLGATTHWLLQADGAAMTLALLTCWVGTATLVHSGLRRSPGVPDAFWPLAWLLLAVLNLVWLGADLLTLYIGVEVLGLVAVAMMTLSGKPEALAAALRYLFATLLGSMAYLVGAGLLFAEYGTLSLPALAEVASANATTGTGFALMLAGLALKAAVFPLHGWLPAAHANALLPVSVLHSALVVKASVFVMMRHWLTLAPPFADSALPLVMATLGALAILWGSVLALRQTRLKLLVAWSTVAQTGYLLLAFPLLLADDPLLLQLAYQGLIYQMLAHGLAKAALFMVAGHLITATGSDRISQLTGTGRHLPLTLLTLGLAGISLMGMPPSAGFAAKWLMASSALGSGAILWMVVLIAGGLLSAAYILKLLREAFREGPERDVFEHPPRLQKMSAFLLSLLTLLLGLSTLPVLSLLIGGAV